MTDREDQSSFVIFRNFAAEFESSAQLELCVAIIIKSEGVCSRAENKVCVKKERVLVQNLAFIAALRDFDRCRHRTAVAEQIAVTNLHTGERAFVSVEPHPETKFLALGFLCRNIESQQMFIYGHRLDLQ